MRFGLGLWVLVSVALPLAACGGKTDSSPAQGGTAGTAGTGNSGGSVGGSGGIGGSVAGSGGIGGGIGGSPGCAPVDTGAACATLGETACLTAAGRCAPVYDDTCCPMCEPTGMCADCVNYRFHECIPYEESGCVPGAIGHCGQTPSWFCQGTAPVCPEGGMCGSVPGCVAVTPACPPDTFCGDICHAVTAWSCGPACVGELAPACDTVAEVAKGGAYTGYCLPSDVCTSGACPATIPPKGTSCGAEGTQCSWGGWCKSTCTCKGGVWDCIIPVC